MAVSRVQAFAEDGLGRWNRIRDCGGKLKAFDYSMKNSNEQV
jgi:hypothetical protein